MSLTAQKCKTKHTQPKHNMQCTKCNTHTIKTQHTQPKHNTQNTIHIAKTQYTIHKTHSQNTIHIAKTQYTIHKTQHTQPKHNIQYTQPKHNTHTMQPKHNIYLTKHNTHNQNTSHQTNMLISNRTADAITQKIPPNYSNMADAEQEETMIRHYFSLNYDYNTILCFLERNHGIKISKRTLLNRLNEYQLRRRHRNVDKEIVRECILRELDGSGSLRGYRSMWRILHSKYGINVPRSVV